MMMCIELNGGSDFLCRNAQKVWGDGEKLLVSITFVVIVSSMAITEYMEGD
jgi:hypothetical protein